jgi:hypothetical protein
VDGGAVGHDEAHATGEGRTLDGPAVEQSDAARPGREEAQGGPLAAR